MKIFNIATLSKRLKICYQHRKSQLSNGFPKQSWEWVFGPSLCTLYLQMKTKLYSAIYLSIDCNIKSCGIFRHFFLQINTNLFISIAKYKVVTILFAQKFYQNEMISNWPSKWLKIKTHIKYIWAWLQSKMKFLCILLFLALLQCHWIFTIYILKIKFFGELKWDSSKIMVVTKKWKNLISIVCIHVLKL